MTAEVKHTKGPWLVRPHWSDESRFEVYPDREVQFGSPAEIADVCAHRAEDFDKEVAEAKANAHLIAAAPEMLQALQELLEAYSKPDERLCCDGRECGCMGSTVHQMAEHYARAAIAKAEGRS